MMKRLALLLATALFVTGVAGGAADSAQQLVVDVSNQVSKLSRKNRTWRSVIPTPFTIC